MPAGSRVARPAIVVAACVIVAVATLAIPAAIAYDPYAWLVWGREVGRLGLDTTGGPSWKPLPVLVTTVVAPLGGLGPALWLVVARTGALLAVVGVFRLASRLAGRWAGAVAVGALVLSPDPGPRFVRLYLEGHTAPLTAALTVWAIDRHLDGKHGTALALATLLALDRPEAWPFLGAYVVWLWVRDPRLRAWSVGLSGLVVVLWFGADWWGSGSPLHGADSARVLADDGHRIVDGLRRVGEVVIAPAWVAAGVAGLDAWRRRDRTVLVLGAGALAWFGLVVAMSAGFGYAALTRFLLPGAAVLCVLAGVGTVRLVAWVPAGSARVAVVVGILVVSLPLVVWRAVGIDGQVRDVVDRGHAIDELGDVIDAAGGPATVRACGRVAIKDAGVPRVAAAWELDVPLGRVRTKVGADRAGVSLEPRRPDLDARVARLEAVTGRPVTVAARRGDWVVYAVDCPAIVDAARGPGT